MFDFSIMEIALQEAEHGMQIGEVPIGAVITTKNKQVLSVAHNEVILRNDPTAHAEILAIRKACERLETHHLDGYEMYVTLEPCEMCLNAILLSRIKKLYFGAYNVKYNSVLFKRNMIECLDNNLEVIGGVKEASSSQILKLFFSSRR